MWGNFFRWTTLIIAVGGWMSVRTFAEEPGFISVLMTKMSSQAHEARNSLDRLNPYQAE